MPNICLTDVDLCLLGQKQLHTIGGILLGGL